MSITNLLEIKTQKFKSNKLNIFENVPGTHFSCKLAKLKLRVWPPGVGGSRSENNKGAVNSQESTGGYSWLKKKKISAIILVGSMFTEKTLDLHPPDELIFQAVIVLHLLSVKRHTWSLFPKLKWGLDHTTC